MFSDADGVKVGRQPLENKLAFAELFLDGFFDVPPDNRRFLAFDEIADSFLKSYGCNIEINVGAAQEDISTEVSTTTHGFLAVCEPIVTDKMVAPRRSK